MNRTTSLNWSPATPEGYDDKNKIVLHVYNFLLVDKQIRKMAVDFIIGKILLYKEHLPKGSAHKIRIDIRGQLIRHKNLDKFRDDIQQRVAKIEKTIPLEIEFLM